MTGEVLLIVDGQVTDSAIFRSDEEKQIVVNQFANVKLIINAEHPYSTVAIDVREINAEK